jgi:dUTP pyrophosphatase
MCGGVVCALKIKTIKFDGYKCPNRAHYNDSGADVFASESIVIPAHSVKAVPTGVGLIIPDGYDAVIHCKSGLSKKGIFTANAPIDSGYRGQIYAIMYNTTDDFYKVEKGQKIGQFVIRPVIYAEFVSSLGEERNEGAFGSTGDR